MVAPIPGDEDAAVLVQPMVDAFVERAAGIVNPVIPAPCGVQAVDIKLRLARIGDEPDPLARSLRDRPGARRPMLSDR